MSNFGRKGKNANVDDNIFIMYRSQNSGQLKQREVTMQNHKVFALFAKVC